MSRVLLVLVACLQLAFTDKPCEILLECRECMPDNMPLVTSHRSANGTVRIPHGAMVRLSCMPGTFVAYPLQAAVTAVCHAGRYRMPDTSIRHLLELGCQENIFEDVQHSVDYCGPPLQGRAYLLQQGASGTRHLAELCYDPDRGLGLRAHLTSAHGHALPLPPHAHARSPLSLLGNFGHMFDARTRSDAEHLYADDARLTRRLYEIFRHDDVTFAGQGLTSAKLLDGSYFEDQEARASDFVSNRVAVWQSVAAGNLRHLQRDVAALVRRAPVDVYAGTHGTLGVRAGAGADSPRRDAVLRGARFPVPRYVWAVVVERATRRALALVVLNDPLVAVSEIRAAVFCESACGSSAWLAELRRHRNYEVPLFGLVFCCDVHNFTRVVTEFPEEIVDDIPVGVDGMLL